MISTEVSSLAAHNIGHIFRQGWRVAIRLLVWDKLIVRYMLTKVGQATHHLACISKTHTLDMHYLFARLRMAYNLADPTAKHVKNTHLDKLRDSGVVDHLVEEYATQAHMIYDSLFDEAEMPFVDVSIFFGSVC
jgi:hypothetical protein